MKNRYTSIDESGFINVSSKHGMEKLRKKAIKELEFRGYSPIKFTRTFQNLVNTLMNSYYTGAVIRLVPFAKFVENMRLQNEAIY